MGLLAWLLSRGRLDLALLTRVITEPALAAITVGVWSLAHVLLPAVRWRALLGLGRSVPGLGRASANQAVALFLNTATPGGLGGDVWKALLADPARERWSFQMALLALERASGVSGVVGVGLLAAGAELAGGLGVVGVLAAAAVILAALVATVRHPRVDALLGRWLPLEARARLPAAVGVSLGASLAHYAVLVAWMVGVAAWLAPVADPVAMARASAVGLFVAALPITPGGIGVGHVVLEGLYGALGYTRGADVYNLFIVPQLALNLLGGLVWLLRDGERGAVPRGR